MSEETLYDRRRFFSQGADRLFTPQSDIQHRSSKIISTLEPLSRLGEPFGARVNTFSCIENTQDQIFVVFGHQGEYEFQPGILRDEQIRNLSKYAGGVSVLEISRRGRHSPWRLNAQSSVNRRIYSGIECALYGSRTNDGNTEDFSEKTTAPQEFTSMLATPWQTVLALGAADGWMAEINPVSGTLLQRFSLGKTSACACQILTAPGKPVRVYSTDRDSGFWRFTSEQKFEARLMSFNQRILDGGLLEKQIDGKWCSQAVGDYAEWVDSLKNFRKDMLQTGAGVDDTEMEIWKRLQKTGQIHSKPQALSLRLPELTLEAENTAARTRIFLTQPIV